MTSNANETRTTVRHNIRLLRKAQSRTYTALSETLESAGCHIPVLGLRRIEHGERRVEVGELVMFAEVFGVMPNQLLVPLVCQQCAGSPPDGYRCRTCGAPDAAEVTS